MLSSMVLDNFQSFDHVELDLSRRNGSVRSHAFIYGENGSGKSNLINAVFFLMLSSGNISSISDGKSVTSGVSVGDVSTLAREFHMIGSEGNMGLMFTFMIDGSRAEYHLEYDSMGMLVLESLEMKINSRKGVIFKLKASHEPTFMRGLIKDIEFRKKIRSETALYWGHKSFVNILNSFSREGNPGFIEENYNPKLMSFLSELRRILVLPTSFRILGSNSITLPKGRLGVDSSDRLKNTEIVLSRFFSRLYSDVTGAFFKLTTENGLIEYELYFNKRISGQIREVPARWESSGTLRLLNMMGPLISCVKGDIVFIDEMDTGVHDLLITGMMDQIIPEITGQLIASTHNTCLMASLSPENVFIIGVDHDGFKRIQPASAIKRVRQSNNIRNMYLNGDFMGIPYIADLGLSDIDDVETEDR